MSIKEFIEQQRRIQDNVNKQWKHFDDKAYDNYRKLIDAFEVMTEALEKLEAGYAGMFGDQNISAEKDSFDLGKNIVTEALTKAQQILKE